MNDPDTPSKRRRREHSPIFKREVVARSLAPGASVAAVALEAGINSNLLFAWRRMHLSAQEQPLTPAPSAPSPMLLPVAVEAAPVVECHPPYQKCHQSLLGDSRAFSSTDVFLK